MAYLDQVINFGKVTIQGTGGLTAGQTSITLESGEGGRLPAFPGNAYNLAITNATDFPDTDDYPNREIVRVTARSGDVLTVTRGQEGTVGFAHPSGKILKMRLVLTKKTMDDIESRFTDLDGKTAAHFRAKRSGGSNQTGIVASTDTKINFNAEDFDRSLEFDAATNFRFVAATARKLVVRAQLRFLSISAAGKLVQCQIWKNGAKYSVGEVVTAASGNFIVAHADSLDLAATDTVEIYGHHNDVASRDVSGAADVTFFSGS